MNVHPIVSFVAQVSGSLGGAALTFAILGTSTLITTSYLMAILFLLMYALLIAFGAYAGLCATQWALNKVSDEACTNYGESIGSALGSVRNLFTRKASA